MSSKSKARAVLDVLMSDMGRRWNWWDIMEVLIPGFSMIPKRAQREILESYMTYLPHVYAEADYRKVLVLRDGVAIMATFKIATTEPGDRPEVDRRLVELNKRKRAVSNRIETRIGNLKETKILPADFDIARLDHQEETPKTALMSPR